MIARLTDGLCDVLDVIVPWSNGHDAWGQKLAAAQLFYASASRLTTAARYIVEALIEQTITEAEVLSARNDARRDHQLLARLKTKGLDVLDAAPLFPDVDALLDEVNVGVQTSHFEGLSLTLLEQMMAGLAIVAPDVGDTRVAVRDKETGSPIPEKDLDLLCSALREVITDPEHRRRRGAAAREIALREFSMTAMTNRALRDLRELAGGRSGAGRP